MSVYCSTTKLDKMRYAVEKTAYAFQCFYTSIGLDYDPSKELWYLWIRRKLKGNEYVARFPISRKDINDEGYGDTEFQERFERFCVAVFEADITQMKDGCIKLDLGE